jgi:hypothetical protein
VLLAVAVVVALAALRPLAESITGLMMNLATAGISELLEAAIGPPLSQRPLIGGGNNDRPL